MKTLTKITVLRKIDTKDNKMKFQYHVTKKKIKPNIKNVDSLKQGTLYLPT